MAPTTNDSKGLGDREPLAAMRDSDWIIYTIGGHRIHHLDQLLSIPNS
jgi:hypothetical protein